MAFRKRRKKSKISRPATTFLVSSSDTSEPSSSDLLSLRFKQHNLDENDARIQVKEPKKKKRRIRIKPSRQLIDEEQNVDKLSKMHSNVGIYTKDYLNSLKNKHKSTMSMPDHIKQAIEQQNESSKRPIQIDSDSSDDHNVNDMDDDIIKAKILSAKLERSTKALATAIDEHAQKSKNTHSNYSNNKSTEQIMSNSQVNMHRFVALGKYKSRREEMIETLNLHNQNDENGDDFDLQQLSKSGIKVPKTITSTTKSAKQCHPGWNCLNGDDDKLTLKDALQLIDTDMNGTQNLVQPPMGSRHVNSKQIEAEYEAVGENIKMNKKQSERLHEKYLFFERIKNECFAYLNCMTEKNEFIQKYTKNYLHLRKMRRRNLSQYHCLNELESFQSAFYRNDFVKDMNAAKAYQKLSDLNQEMNENYVKNNDKQQQNGDCILSVWNEQKLDIKQYILDKCKRSEKRINAAKNECYSYVHIEEDYFVKRQKLLNKIEHLFDDTRIEYRSFDVLSKNFEEWKRQYREDYDNAFVSISIPKVISPFVRLELIQWNALRRFVNIDKESDDQSTIVMAPPLFVEHKWCKLMAQYGLDENGQMGMDDADDLIVPTLIASIIVPEIVCLIEFDWNPYSMEETKQILKQSHCAMQHIDCYKQFEAKCKLIKDAVLKRCEEEVDNLIYLKCIPMDFIQRIMPKFKSLPSKPLDGCEYVKGAMYEYVKKRVMNALKLLHCVSVIVIGINVKKSVDFVKETMINVYKSVIEAFVTYLSRAPIRSAKDDEAAKIEILSDFCEIIKAIFAIRDDWKMPLRNDDEDDVVMSSDVKLPESISKHISRSVNEITENMDGMRLNPLVNRYLGYLTKV